MNCAKCNGDTAITDSRLSSGEGPSSIVRGVMYVRRVRVCKRCSHRITTVELRAEDVNAAIVNALNDGLDALWAAVTKASRLADARGSHREAKAEVTKPYRETAHSRRGAVAQ